MPLLYEDLSFRKSFSQVKDSEVTLTIVLGYPSSTIQIVDYLTKKPITNALVVADSKEYTSDSNGAVVLDLPKGTYTVSITHPQYLHKSLTLTIPMTEPLTVQLTPIWVIALGIMATVTVSIAVAAKVVWRK